MLYIIMLCVFIYGVTSSSNLLRRNDINLSGDVSRNETINWDTYQRMFPGISITPNSESTFLNNLEFIISHNSLNRSYKLGINSFMHISEGEWKSRFDNLTQYITVDESTYEKKSFFSTPASWDWREQGVTTSVKDQKSCGSCYSFSATETVETTWAIRSSELLVLSPQQIVDCSKLNSGCNGGLQSRVYKYLQSTEQCLESDYQYTAVDGKCVTCKGAISKLSGYVSIKAGDEKAMEQSLFVTSLAVAIQADQKEFQLYKSGVLDFNCGKTLDHAVTIEGYGTENGKDYWLVRNSWGTTWGEKGYIKMARGKDLCGISQSVVYPKF